MRSSLVLLAWALLGRGLASILDILFFIVSLAFAPPEIFGKFAVIQITILILTPILVLAGPQIIVSEGKRFAGDNLWKSVSNTTISWLIVITLIVLTQIVLKFWKGDFFAIKETTYFTLIIYISVLSNHIRAYYNAIQRQKELARLTVIVSVVAFLIPFMLLKIGLTYEGLLSRLFIPHLVFLILTIKVLKFGRLIPYYNIRMKRVVPSSIIDNLTNNLFQLFTVNTLDIASLGIINRAEFIRNSVFNQFNQVINSVFIPKYANDEISLRRKKVDELTLSLMLIGSLPYIGYVFLSRKLLEIVLEGTYLSMFDYLDNLIGIAWVSMTTSFLVQLDLVDYKGKRMMQYTVISSITYILGYFLFNNIQDYTLLLLIVNSLYSGTLLVFAIKAFKSTFYFILITLLIQWQRFI